MNENYRIKQVDDRFYIQEKTFVKADKILFITISKAYEYWHTINMPYDSLEKANNIIYKYLHQKEIVEKIHEYQDLKL